MSDKLHKIDVLEILSTIQENKSAKVPHIFLVELCNLAIESFELNQRILHAKIYADSALVVNDCEGMHSYGQTPDWFVGLAAFVADVNMDNKDTRAGTIRYVSKHGQINYSEPGSVSYSTALFSAQQQFNGKEWVELKK